MEPLERIGSRVVLLPLADIDTDQIIPARFLKSTTREGMGDHLFADLRFNPDGTPKPTFPLNRPENRGAQILLTGANFGCGSSREHAPWALAGFGFCAIISPSFADIFRANALKNRLVPVTLDARSYESLLAWLTGNPKALVTIDITTQEVTWGDSHRAHFDLDPFSRICLMKGTDELGYILGMMDRIEEYERRTVGESAP